MFERNLPFRSEEFKGFLIFETLENSDSSPKTVLS